MTNRSHAFRAFVALGGFALAVAAGTVRADLPSNLSDIPYQSTEWGQEQLRFRGYTFISADYHEGKLYEYWWQGSSNTCVQARAYDGRYESLKTTAATDCNQYHAAATKNDNAAAIAVGAAAILGAAVLAHQSHERHEKHGKDQKSVAEFDRGYRDGLYHQPYHNYQNTSAYSDGYGAGIGEREEHTYYRGRQVGYGGYQPYVSVDDLVGARASSADSQLRSRGFADTGGYKQGGKSFVTWHNARTRQCLEVVTRDGAVRHISSLNEGNCL